MSSHVLEVVTFSTLPGTDEQKFLRAAEEANSAIRGLKGFVGRRLVKTESGQWMDIVEWTDAESAADAAKIFHTLDAAKPFCGMIAMDSTAMAHHLIAISTG